MTIDLPLWYETDFGDVICGYCRAEHGDEEGKRPRALGRRPWAGAPAGDRYMQCDVCSGQWGPDA